MFNNRKAGAMAYRITVRDTFCGVRGVYCEEQECISKQEADDWVKQFKSEYPKEDGYKITLTTI